MADKATVLQNAQKFMAKGQIDKAIVEWQKLISESPNDGNIYNTIGDLLLKKGDTSRSVDAYLKGAEVFHRAGFSLKTIAIYKKLIKLVPQRFDILIKLGDLNAERGLTGNAIEDYLTAAKQYTQQGDIKEALEVYRKIANLDPSNTTIRMKLADLCLKEGLQKEAVDEFIKVAEAYVQLGQRKEAEALSERILKLDPQNESIRTLLGKPAPSRASTPKEQESVPEDNLMSMIEEKIQNDDLDQARKILGRFPPQDPAEPIGYQKVGMAFLKAGKTDEAFEICKTAVERFMGLNEFGQAGKLMKEYLEADADRSDAHVLLGEIYEKGGNAHLAVSAYAHVIDDYLASGDAAQARAFYAKIKALEPEHRDVKRLRHSFETIEPSEPSLSAEILKAESGAAGGSAEKKAEPKPSASAMPESEPSLNALRTAPTSDSPSPVVDSAAINSLLTEAEVYLKYGLAAKAIEQIEQALSMDPENEQAHIQLKDLYKSENQNDKAVEECFHLIEIYKRTGNGERRSAVLDEAKELDPENPRIREATDLAPILESGRMKAILDAEQDEVIPEPGVGERLAQKPADSGADETVGETRQETVLPTADLGEQTAEADFYYQQGLRDEAKRMYSQILTQQPDNSAALQGLDTIAKDEVVESKEKEKNSVLQESAFAEEAPPPRKNAVRITPPVSIAPATAKSKSADEAMLDEELEKSFAPFMGSDERNQDEIGEEAVSQAPLRTKKPVHSESGATDVQDDDKRRRPDDGFPKNPRKKKEESADLSDTVGHSVNAKVKGSGTEFSSDEKTINEELDSIFSEFQKDAQEQIDDIDYETHYNLGIAYKEMGLVNEAMIEFKQAMKGPDRFIDSSNMLAACYRESGNDREAIGILESALSNSKCDETQARWLRYDLASLYEEQGRTDEALTLFKEVSRTDRNFKDVAQRIETLEGNSDPAKRKKISSKESPSEDEDVDAMMDRIFGDSSPATPSREETESSREHAADHSNKKDRISYL